MLLLLEAVPWHTTETHAKTKTLGWLSNVSVMPLPGFTLQARANLFINALFGMSHVEPSTGSRF